MALMLAPYNEAMRIGTGFNSYTQQLCVNDVVRKPGGKLASEKDLQAVKPSSDQMQVAGSDAMLCKPCGSFYKARSDGTPADVSQMVSWKAGFVDSLSDVSSSLNITGALTITCAAIGGGGGANGKFNNSTKFLKSDAKYNIEVKVTNQKLIANDVTEFTPIPNVQASKFNEVYGDCFISGFIEGGVLSAMVLRSIVDKDDSKHIGGGINIDIDLKAVTVKGSADGGKTDSSKDKTVETTIDITWSGGGDIKPDNITEWDIPTLTRVAMEFPDKVAICPQRTYAILTKYTSLRSYHEQTVLGSPLDYEIAGIYTNSLLDAYMEYKAMWEDLSLTMKAIDKGTSMVKSRKANDKLIAYRTEVQTDYDKRLARYNESREALVRAPEYQSQIILVEPLPANKVEPYGADAFGIDQAARDCRFEMIKIVREVNDVTADPKVATDPTRTWRYLSPHVFRLLVPTDKEPLPSPEEIAKLKSDLEAKITECIEREHELAEARKERATLAADKESQARETAADSERQIIELKTTGADATRRCVELEQRLTNRDREVNEANNKCNDLLRRLSEFEREKEGLNNEPEVQIFNITWGGRQLMGDSGVSDRVRNHIVNRIAIPMTNDFFGCDPIYGQRKMGTVVYKRRGCPVVMLEDWEGVSRNTD